MFTTVSNTKRYYTLTVLLLFAIYATGIIGLQLTTVAPLFKSLVPLNLLVSLGVLLWFHTDWQPAFSWYAIGVVLAGFMIEVIGVHTGLIFGEYAYGPVLGPHWLGVPPIIGLNWLLLAYCCGSVCNPIKIPTWAKSATAASLMVLLDLLIEPVAIRFNFWTWNSPTVPMQNYIAWWLFSFILSVVWFKLPFQKSNRLAGWMLIVQFLFFAAHFVLIKTQG